MPQDTLQPIIITPSKRRRKPRRRFRIAPLLWRFGALTAAIALVVMLVSTAVAPYIKQHRQRAETKDLAKSLSEAKSENRSLQRELHMLKSGKGLEREARRLGYVRQGEIPIQITVPPPSRPE